MKLSDKDPYLHQPVLYHESLKYLQPKLNGKYIDGTIGTGGHAEGILAESAPSGLLLGIDLDEEALIKARKRLSKYGERVVIQKGSYADLNGHLKTVGWNCVDGVLIDLGLSSMQLDTAERGFSFRKDAPLDMRFDPQSGKTAAFILNSFSESYKGSKHHPVMESFLNKASRFFKGK